MQDTEIRAAGRLAGDVLGGQFEVSTEGVHRG